MPPRDIETPSTAYGLMQVADFMGDDQNVQKLCIQVSAWLVGESPQKTETCKQHAKVRPPAFANTIVPVDPAKTVLTALPCLTHRAALMFSSL